MAVTDFADRLSRIEAAHRKRPARRGPSLHRSGRLLIMPLSCGAILVGALTFTWDTLDRPTQTPFALAGLLMQQGPARP